MMKKIFLILFLAFTLLLTSCTYIDEVIDRFSMGEEKIVKDCPLKEGERTVFLGMHKDEVASIFGPPLDAFTSEYGFTWNIYHENFKNYIQIGIKDDVVVGIYTNSEDFSIEGIAQGTKKEDINLKLGTAENGIVKGSTRYLSNGAGNTANIEIYQIRGAYVTFFYDTHKNNSLTSVNIIDYDVEQAFDMLYAKGTSELKQSFEVQNFYLLNAIRAREGLSPFTRSSELDTIATAHSRDMTENGYFSHYSLNGDSVLERAQDYGIVFRRIGENLAMGAQNSIYLHELLMNSDGHRENILGDYTHVGMGIAFLEDGTPYLTQNFLK